MTNTRFLRALAAASTAFMVLSAPGLTAAPALGAVAAAPTEADSAAVRAGIAAARKLNAVGRFEEALTVLRPLVGGRTVHADALFLFGLATLGASRAPGIDGERREALLDEAIAAFHSMLVTRPDLIRVRLELGRAFFLKGEDSLARRHFEQVLAGKPPAAVALNVSRFLSIMRARKRWSVRVGAALAPDSNIGAGSDERTIYILGLPFRRDQEELTSSGVGISVWAGGEYQSPLAGRWRLRAGGDVSRREYRAREFDRMTVAAHVGPRWLVGRGSEASLLLSARQHWLAGEPDHRDIGLRAELHRRLTPRLSAALRASWHERRYDELNHLDGPVTEVSLSGRHALGPTVRLDTAAGWGRERPKTKRYRHTRYWLRAGMTFALPWGFTVAGSGTLRWTDYDDDWGSIFSPHGVARNDLTRSLRLDAHNRGFDVAGFSPQVSLVQEQRTSNAQLHGYEKVFGELRFVRLF